VRVAVVSGKGRMLADRTGLRKAGLACKTVSLVTTRLHQSTLTCLAYGLLAARQPKGIHSQLAADGAPQLDGDVIWGERARERSASRRYCSRCGQIAKAYLMSSA